jgi:hypothetical protein
MPRVPPPDHPPSSLPRLRLTEQRLQGLSKKERIKLATEEVEKGTTIRKAAEKYGLPYSTLQYYVTEPTVGKGQNLLTEEEEERALVNKIKEQQRSRPMSKKEVLLEVNEIVNSRRKTPRTKLPSNTWWRNFKDRNPEVKLRKVKAADKYRQEAEVTVDVNEWYKKLEDIIAVEKIPLQNIFNFDEKKEFVSTQQKRSFASTSPKTLQNGFILRSLKSPKKFI